MKKPVILTASVVGIILGIIILITSLADIEMPKIFWLIYTICMLIVSCANIAAYLKVKKADK
ncbi:MAG: hypothetical protein II690_04515 [Ruminococcus sp.]|nr:hypothetical protein [Ruminococcus sp.]